MSEDRTAVTFGDADPEDAWDDGDSEDAKLDVLERIVQALRHHQDDERFDARRVDALRLLDKVVRARAERRDRLERIRDQLEEL